MAQAAGVILSSLRDEYTSTDIEPPSQLNKGG